MAAWQSAGRERVTLLLWWEVQQACCLQKRCHSGHWGRTRQKQRCRNPLGQNHQPWEPSGQPECAGMDPGRRAGPPLPPRCPELSLRQFDHVGELYMNKKNKRKICHQTQHAIHPVQSNFCASALHMRRPFAATGFQLIVRYKCMAVLKMFIVIGSSFNRHDPKIANVVKCGRYNQ